MRNRRLEENPRFKSLLSALEERGFSTYRVCSRGDLCRDTDFLLSVGGDGTFLSAAALSGDSGIPVLGVNLGRLGFLSENKPEIVPEALAEGKFTIENRTLINLRTSAETGCAMIDGWPYALNEMTVRRSGAAMLGIDVEVDGAALPTYWADGLLVATSSGSTAYSLSVGGPVVMPESDVFIIAPIASHNLSVRPLVVPGNARISVSMRSRDEKVLLTADNRTVEACAGMRVEISSAGFPLKKVRIGSQDFIDALTSKLFWGEDMRNSTTE